jgi:hypothetical protein
VNGLVGDLTDPRVRDAAVSAQGDGLGPEQRRAFPRAKNRSIRPSATTSGRSAAARGGSEAEAARRAGVGGCLLDTAVKDGRIKKGDLLLLEGIGGGLAWGASLVRW